MSKVRGIFKKLVDAGTFSGVLESAQVLAKTVENTASKFLGNDSITATKLHTLADDDDYDTEAEFQQIVEEANIEKNNQWGSKAATCLKAMSKLIKDSSSINNKYDCKPKIVMSNEIINTEEVDKTVLIPTASKFNEKVSELTNTNRLSAIGSDVVFSVNGEAGSFVNVKYCNLPTLSENLLDPNYYPPTNDVEKVDPTGQSKITNTLFNNTIVNTNDVLELYKELFIKYGINRNDFKEFVNKISLIWGYKKYDFKFSLESDDDNEADLTYIDSYNELNELDKFKNPTTAFTDSLSFDQVTYKNGVKIFRSKTINGIKPRRFCTGSSALILEKIGNIKSINTKNTISGMVSINPAGFPENGVVNYENYNFSFSFVTKKRLLELAKLFIKKDNKFDELLLQTVHENTSTNGFISVFKNGKLHRFIRKEELNNLEEDEEYEECRTKVILI